MIRQVVNLTRPDEVETGMLLAVPRYRAYLVHDDTSTNPSRRVLIGYPSLDAAADDARILRRAKMDAAAVERCDMAGYPWRNVHWADDLEDLMPAPRCVGMGRRDCLEPVAMVDDKGFVYCTECGDRRKPHRPTRKLTGAELGKIRRGETLPSY